MDNVRWKKYLRVDDEDYSGSCEVNKGAREQHQELLDQLPEGNYALDIGCGTGWSTEELSEKYRLVIGISIQRAEIDFACKNHRTEKTLFIEMDMHSLTFTDELFDLIYMRETLEHSIAPFIALAEANRVLKTGGIIMVNTPPLIDKWLNWHCHYFVPTPEQLKAFIIKTNFEVLKMGIGIGGHNYCLAKKVQGVSFGGNKG